MAGKRNPETMLLISALLLVAVSASSAQAAKPISMSEPERGKEIFARHCSFCHGRDAAGGESGPDLTSSRLVARDVRGDRIRAVIHDGRTEKGMPAFPGLALTEVNEVIAFVRDQTRKLKAKPGGRSGVDVADLQTGNVEQGKAYFNGPGKCSSCHSPTGDLAGIATRREGLELEMQMLYPQNAKSKLTVTTASGQTFSGTLTFKDEFHIAMTDSEGWHRSWPIRDVQFKIDSPVEAHSAQFEKYTDDDIHNLMAYLQTLK
jgi:cytochrome c oxidase cbb3-type subunit III